jgi:peptidoglycan/LPS O-acetylase OafA/YrhL
VPETRYAGARGLCQNCADIASPLCGGEAAGLEAPSLCRVLGQIKQALAPEASRVDHATCRELSSRPESLGETVMDDALATRGPGLRPNNFDLLRLAAAMQVGLLHMVEHLGLPLSAWMVPLTWFPGVPIFFVLSGFLVSLSYERNPDLRNYAANRLLRIFPALWICFVFSVVSVACLRPDLLATASPASILWWVTAQSSIAQMFTPDFLRDYGVGALNGSLWTIPVELQFYAVVPILYAVLRLCRRRSAAMLMLMLAGMAVNRVFAEWKLSAGDSLSVKLFGSTFVPHVWYFLAGIVIQQNFGRLRPWLAGKALWWLAAHLLCCVWLGRLGWHVAGNLVGPLPSLTLIGATFSLGYTFPTLSERVLRSNDISYGTYLYHMVIVNAVIELGLPATPGTVATIIAVTLACAVLSWKLVERPALMLKPRVVEPVTSTREIAVESPAGTRPSVELQDPAVKAA